MIKPGTGRKKEIGSSTHAASQIRSRVGGICSESLFRT